MSQEPRFLEALTFDDVTLAPCKSDVLPNQTQTTTWFTRNVPLNVPFSSAAMDTVTEARFAIAIAQLGGIGVLHKNMSIERQRGEVDLVKRSVSGMIVNPFRITPDRPLAEALDLMKQHRIAGIPVVDEQEHLVGILTNRDLRFEDRLHLPVGELMTRDVISAPTGTTLEQAREIFRQRKIEKLPTVDSQGRLTGLITVKDLQKVVDFPHAAKDKLGRLRVAAAVGVGKDYFDRAKALVETGVDVLVVDTAHGHSTGVLNALERLRSAFPDVDLVGGNIATAEAAEDLIATGVDAVKVGMGPGSICTTRVVTGVGLPQVTAVLECCEAALKHGIPVIADGGIEQSGQVVKILAAGASSVMIGGQFAGTDETPGEIVLYQGRSYKEYRGMGSLAAMRMGSADRYGQEEQHSAKLVPEGIEGRVPHKGPLAQVMEQFVGGLRNGMGYLGCRTIEELRQQSSRFRRQSLAGVREGHVHGVIVTKEAPNYRVDNS